MSILYKLFGVPGTLDEYIDKVKKHGYEKVNITLTYYERYSRWNNCWNEYHLIIIQEQPVPDSKNLKEYRLKKHPEIKIPKIQTHACGTVTIKNHHYSNCAIALAKQLENEGLTPLINDLPLDCIIANIDNEQYDPHMCCKNYLPKANNDGYSREHNPISLLSLKYSQN